MCLLCKDNNSEGGLLFCVWAEKKIINKKHFLFEQRKMASYSDNESFDDYFAQIANRSGGIDQLLNSFFGFLHRKTDFYVEFPPGTASKMGFPIGAAEKLVQRAFKQYPMKQLEISTKGSSVADELSISTQKVSSGTAETKVMPRITEDGKV